jgi:diguanylate cyclase (GGDEF)-like protein
VIRLDIRRLKSVNDTFGHDVGDELLRSVARSLRASARKSDVAARIGADEFAVLLLGAGQAGAEVFLERIRSSVGSVQLPDGDVINVQLAAGIAVRQEAESLHEALLLADGRLVLDKQRGHE